MEADLTRSVPKPVLRLAAVLLFSPIVFSTLAVTPAAAQQTMVTSEKIWQSIKDDVLGNRPVSEEAIGVVRLEAPKRAQDAALVPSTFFSIPRRKTSSR
jgi:sulfur-oxidizing protein SoxY